MQTLAAALEGFALAEWLRYSRWLYASLSATHLLGISLLLGTVIALDLRLLGLGRVVTLGQLYRLLAPLSAAGLVIAVCTGLLLFMVRATEYVLLDLFFVKLLLIISGAAIAALMHFGLDIERLSRGRQRLLGALSLLLWLSVLTSGRMLAFV